MSFDTRVGDDTVQLVALSQQARRLNSAGVGDEGSHSSRLRPSESWINITSSPTALSPDLPSNAASDLSNAIRSTNRVGSVRRRRTVRPHMILDLGIRRPSIDCSSQEEYDESESESDKVLTSSNEGLATVVMPRQTTPLDNDDENHREEIRTVLNMPRDLQCFTPQPNLFSHPPSSQASRHHDGEPESYFPATRPMTRTSSSRQSMTTHQSRQQQSITAQPSFIPAPPPPRSDHDEALRASLSTLLSCAAAARGLPKAQSSSLARVQPKASRVDVSSIRVVPEAIALGNVRRLSPPRRIRTTPTSSRDSSSPADTTEKSKRKAAARDPSKERRAAKKVKYLAVDEQISPTLLTWFTAAGFVVFVSALSFSTGFVLGRATGRLEASGGFSSSAGDAGNCSSEVTRGMGLKRLRWSSAASAIA